MLCYWSDTADYVDSILYVSIWKCLFEKGWFVFKVSDINATIFTITRQLDQPCHDTPFW